jgi:hypothetical protein
VHWLGTWQLDDIDNEVNMHQWVVRDVDQCWKNYGRALDELCATHAVDVLAHPDLIKVAGYIASNPAEVWDAMADSAARVDISMECSSAGWKKPVGEQYPAEGFLDRLVEKVSRSPRPLTPTASNEWASGPTISRRCSKRAACSELASYTQRQRQMIPLRAQYGHPRGTRAVRTDLDEPSIDHLCALIASWSLLADLAFSDMLLMAKVTEDGGTTRVSWCSARCGRTTAPR